ncbi:MAG: prepilin-type N-terminal cleavage/methylation domain-containing protein [Phycisphaerae bacterium]|nr:prepilin-type N-terminal cleavage/methylation domain-containing protein [Phycisphaerae bacterium]
MKRKKGFTLIELLVVVAIIALLISILLPSLSRARELSKRLVCGANIKGIGTSCKIYANENEEMWPMPAFIDNNQTAKVWWNHGTGGVNLLGPDVVTGDKRTSVSININTTTISVTRCFWMLVRSGEVTPKQFICPSSGDQQDGGNAELYYDFESLNTVSYGYRVPYGPNDTRPSENLDSRMIVAADKGPVGTGAVTTNAQLEPIIGTFFVNAPPSEWVAFNSPNHGGKGQGEGQNCLFADGHASFERKPVAGIDNDNIYTAFGPSVIGTAIGRSRGIVEFSNTALWFPGMRAFDATLTGYSTTDALIYP